MISRRIGSAGASLLALAVVAACSTGGDDGSTGGEAGPLDRLTVVLSGDYNSLDPAKTTNIYGNQMSLALYDRLLTMTPQGELAPGLAESWKATSTEAVFTIKSGVKCSDGTDLTATTVANSVRRYADPDTAATYRARVFGTATPTVTADDAARTVTVKLDEPFSEMLVGFSMPWTSILCQKSMDDPNVLATAPIGTGPYTLVEGESIRGNRYTLAVRDEYGWGPNGATAADLPRQVLIRVITEQATIANELAAGSADAALVAPDQVARLEADPDLKRTDASALGSYFLMYRQASGSPFVSKDLREALSLSVDRTALAQAATRGFGTPATSYITPAVPCFFDGKDTPGAKFDAAASEAKFTSLGYAKNADGLWAKDGKPLTVRLIASSQNAPTGTEYLGTQLRAAGIDVKIQQYTLSDLLDFMGKSADWDLAIFPYQPPIPSPNSGTTFFRNRADGSPGTNYSRIVNPTFDKSVDAALEVSPDDPSRCQLWQTAQQALLDEIQVSPLFTPSNVWITTKRMNEPTFVGPGSIDLTAVRAAG